MEHPTPMTWPEQLHENTLITAGEDEFSNFLEFDMQFPDLEGHGPSHSQMQDQQQQQQHAMGHPPTSTAPSTMASDPRSHPYAAPMEGLAMDFGHPQVQSQSNLPYSTTPQMTPGFCAQDSSHSSAMSQPPPQHYMQGHPIIPPTPNSMELHGNAARYSQRMDDNPEMYDHRYSRVAEDQVCLKSSLATMPRGCFRVGD